MYHKGTGRLCHSQIGDKQVRAVFKYSLCSGFEIIRLNRIPRLGLHFNKRLNWGLATATADMARKTFVTMGDRYFNFPWKAMICDSPIL